MKNFIQPGNTITWTNGTGAAVVSGQVVPVGNILAVAAVNIADGSSGELVTDGVFDCPKVTAAVIGQGGRLLWDVSAGKFDVGSATPATGDVSNAAVAWEAAGNGATVVKARLGHAGAVA
jgi:predicted RecA/RadA family phage recombinase